jgi:hypothetical protein
MRTRIGWIVALVVVAVTPSARASHGPIDTLFVLNSMSLPVLALDPTTGDRHVAYISDAILTHAWETAGVWQSEAIVDSASLNAYYSFQLRVAPDGHPVAAYVRKGALVCAIRDGGGWQRDTLDVGLPAPFYPIALDLNRTTGEPAVAWAHKSASPASPSQIFYARHSGGTWTTQLVDTTSSSWLNVALGFDGAGRPHLAWARPRGDAAYGVVLTYGEGAGPDGPFTAAPVDSELYSFLALAMDRSNGEPRLVYVGILPSSFNLTVRYAYRAPGGSWQRVVVTGGNGSGNPPGPALSLDTAGNPFISLTNMTPIEPDPAPHPAPDGVEACAFIETGDVRVYYRAGGAGSGSFSFENVSFPQTDTRSGIAAVASSGTGQAIVAWRSPGNNCSPFALTVTNVTGPSLTGVGGDGDTPALALSPVWPNPARPGDALRVEFGLPRQATVSFELHDLAGRRAAVRAPTPMSAGRHSEEWSVPDLSPGLYWLTVRMDGGRIGTRSVVILR